MSFQTEIQSKQVFSSVDRAIIQETNEDVRKLVQDLKDLNEIQTELSHLLGEQAKPLAVCEERTAQAFENSIKGTEKIEEASKLVGDRHRFTIFVAGGGTIGGALGAIGFVANPIVGTIALAVCAVVGALSGAAVDKITKD